MIDPMHVQDLYKIEFRRNRTALPKSRQYSSRPYDQNRLLAPLKRSFLILFSLVNDSTQVFRSLIVFGVYIVIKLHCIWKATAYAAGSVETIIFHFRSALKYDFVRFSPARPAKLFPFWIFRYKAPVMHSAKGVGYALLVLDASRPSIDSKYLF
jgi:hypothetical protein